MKILHIWNTAGVASVVAKFLDRKFHTESTVMARKKYDRVGLTTYGKAYEDGATRFFLRAMFAARRSDIVHVYSWDRIVPWLKRLYPGKPVVLYYVGTDVLSRWEAKRPSWSRADRVAYSTLNLASGAPDRAQHIPAPVDTDLFYPRSVERKSGSALARRYGMDREVEELARARGLTLQWMDTWGTAHAELPGRFSSVEYFIDLRRPEGHSAPVASVGKASLEALACGCKVIAATGETLEGLPEENSPQGVAKKWHQLYRELLKQGSQA